MAWICCQRGAREHYSIPRALYRRGELELLLTDFWQAPLHLPAISFRRISGRFHPELKLARVKSFNARTVGAEVGQKILRSHWFAHQQRLNRQFQAACVKVMDEINDKRPRTVFAFSYAAREILTYAKSRGWKTVLGQIDPGPRESEIVMEEHRRLGWKIGEVYQAPQGYWDDWRAETELADKIVANSAWSVRCLKEVGVSESKLEVIPCAYEAATPSDVSRLYPDTFTSTRPFEVLFLGQTILRKGIHIVIEAAEVMRNEPVRFTVAGGTLKDLSIAIPSNVQAVGVVPRDRTAALYRQADVFVLPTLSDGFALTQLEALAWGLPVIATERCGDVVSNQINGIILTECTAKNLVNTLRRLMADPGMLRALSTKTGVSSRFTLDTIGRQLLEVAA